jgi:hypothetical protein
MTKLGIKFNSSFKRIGSKFDKGAKNLGNKIQVAMGHSDPFFRKLDNSLQSANAITSFIPGVSQGVGIGAGVAHVAHAVSKRGNKKNKLEKYNPRKAKEDKQYNSAVMKSGFA